MIGDDGAGPMCGGGFVLPMQLDGISTAESLVDRAAELISLGSIRLLFRTSGLAPLEIK